jgi:hypothetical protein
MADGGYRLRSLDGKRDGPCEDDENDHRGYRGAIAVPLPGTQITIAHRASPAPINRAADARTQPAEPTTAASDCSPLSTDLGAG